MSDWPLLSLVTFLPLVGAGFIFLFAQGGGEAADRNAKGVALMTTVLAGFGRANAEVGAVMIVGGNIDHVTRVMTTAIALEASRGDLALALGLGIVLLLLSLAINAASYSVREFARHRYQA